MKLMNVTFLLLLLYTKLNGQASIMDLRPHVNVQPDSLFKVFVAPSVPEVILNKNLSDEGYYEFKVLVYIEIDTNCKVRHLKKYPLYGWGNDLNQNSIIWNALLKSVDSVSKLWVLKPVNHKIPNDWPDTLKQFFNKINRGETRMGMRPFGGRQFHCVILNIYCYRKYSPSGEPFEPMFLYWMNVNLNK